jgi:2-polyprenyl-3-methyl-5-hydroxy-6-metoxy-1,4-benzoquinol methylase
MSTSQSKGEGPRSPFGMRGSHTRLVRQEDFELAYRAITPAWEIGRPQRAFLNLILLGEISGEVLDVGCGTGEHVLMAAAAGLDAVGIDISPTAISKAEGKASSRGFAAKFFVLDALQMTALDGRFDTVLDCGMFHNLGNEDRPVFADSLRTVLRPGGHYFMLCFSDQQIRFGAARTISKKEIYTAFSNGFHIDSIESALLEENASDGTPAWLAKITRIG